MKGTAMNVQDMRDLVERHLKAEGAGDIEGAVAVYTDDIEHDDVGMPGGVLRGKDAARDFYEILTANFRTTGEKLNREYVADNALIIDEIMTGNVVGSMLGLPGRGREISFRILHVFEFKDGLISRENVWLDGGAIAAQLSSPADD